MCLCAQGVFLFWLKAVPLSQKTFKVEADSLHLTLVGRFIYDVIHFVSEAREIASVLSAPNTSAPAELKPQQSTAGSYRPIIEVSTFMKHCFHLRVPTHLTETSLLTVKAFGWEPPDAYVHHAYQA